MSSSATSSATSSTFNLDTYISNYSGHTRQKRLEFIAAHSEPLQRVALERALEEVKQTSNTTLYNDLIAAATALDPEHFQRDDAWVEAVDKASAQKLEKLESELSAHKTSLVKESIRIGYNDLGDFHCERGDFQAALKCYVRMRDYCTTSKHANSMCMSVIKVSIHMGNFTHVANYVTKAESTPDASDTQLHAQLRCASGLSLLSTKKFKLAARKFLETSADLGEFSEVLSAQDVALYGGLCALATSDRQELKSKLIEGSFAAVLDLYPSVRELVGDFYASRYAECLSRLDTLKAALNIDMHLHDHVDELCQMIRSKALIQYFSPFVTVDMHRMASAFNASVDDLEAELAQLIMGGQIPARIDSQAKVLHARRANQRSETFAKALRMGDEYMRDTKALLLRLNLLKADLTVRGKEPASMGPSKASRQDDSMGLAGLAGELGTPRAMIASDGEDM